MQLSAESLGGRSAGTRRRGFTVVEILVVMVIILVLAGLVLATSSYVHNKGARSRAEAEIAAMSAALENYKADNGVYVNSTSTSVDAHVIDFPKYMASTLYLYGQLAGASTDGTAITGATSYFNFTPAMLLRDDMSKPVSSTNLVKALRDPFGNSYGYSTAGPGLGYNPTFDFWSTAGSSDASSTPNPSGWVKNW